ncbi:hypothetical protein PENTCL1PPCAC_467, partial [Pristionchus entomophagus]
GPSRRRFSRRANGWRRSHRYDSGRILGQGGDRGARGGIDRRCIPRLDKAVEIGRPLLHSLRSGSSQNVPQTLPKRGGVRTRPAHQRVRQADGAGVRAAPAVERSDAQGSDLDLHGAVARVSADSP